jgi:hypothetical protein
VKENSDHETESSALEREKWQAEQSRLDREFAFRDRELQFKETMEDRRLKTDFELRKRELCFKEAEARRARLWNPLAIAIFGAAVAAAGNVYVSWQSGRASLELETFKAEAARIFEVVKTPDPDFAAKNLGFLIDLGLIQDKNTVASIGGYLKTRKKGEGFALPSSGSTSGSNCLREYRDSRTAIAAYFDLLQSESKPAGLDRLKEEADKAQTAFLDCSSKAGTK